MIPYRRKVLEKKSGARGQGQRLEKGHSIFCCCDSMPCPRQFKEEKAYFGFGFQKAKSLSWVGKHGSKRWAWQQAMGMAASDGRGSKWWARQQAVGVAASGGRDSKRWT